MKGGALAAAGGWAADAALAARYILRELLDALRELVLFRLRAALNVPQVYLDFLRFYCTVTIMALALDLTVLHTKRPIRSSCLLSALVSQLYVYK